MNTQNILKLADIFEKNCQSLIVEARIRKLPNGKYRVLSEKGKNLGTMNSKEDAVKRLNQIEFFKHKGNADDKQNNIQNIIDLTKATDFSYSAIMREMRQNANKDQFLEFIKLFKKYFDKAIKEKLQKPEKIALQNSLIKFKKKHKIKIKNKIVKNAAVSELGDPVLVGRYLSDIVKFTLNRLSPDSRPKAINNLKNKFYTLNVSEISQKNLPAGSAIGQSITFVKHVLFNHDPHYIREVLNSLVRNL